MNAGHALTGSTAGRWPRSLSVSTHEARLFTDPSGTQRARAKASLGLIPCQRGAQSWAGCPARVLRRPRVKPAHSVGWLLRFGPVRRIPLGALQEREFRLFFTGQFVSLLGDAVTPFALAWAVLDLTGSARDLGFVIAAKTAPLVIFLLVGGVFADRLPRRGVMLTADVTRMGIQAATAALLLSHTARVWELIVLQAFAGAATAFFNPASTGLTPMTVSAERLQGANALRGMSMAATQLAGPAVAGILIVTVGPGYALAIDAASFAVSAFCLARLHLPLHVNLPPQSFARDLLDGWREFVARTWVWLTVVSASLANMMSAVWLVLAATWVKQGHGGAGAWTVILIVSRPSARSSPVPRRSASSRDGHCSWAPSWWFRMRRRSSCSPCSCPGRHSSPPPLSRASGTCSSTRSGRPRCNNTSRLRHSRASAPTTGLAPCSGSRSASPSQEWRRPRSG